MDFMGLFFQFGVFILQQQYNDASSQQQTTSNFAKGHAKQKCSKVIAEIPKKITKNNAKEKTKNIHTNV